MTESELYQKHIKPFLNSKGAFFFRVEHPRVPDIYTAKDRRVLWLELKCINHPILRRVCPDWRPGQLAWIKEHERLGGELIVLCLCISETGAIYFLPPREYYELNEIPTLSINKGDLYG